MFGQGFASVTIKQVYEQSQIIPGGIVRKFDMKSLLRNDPMVTPGVFLFVGCYSLAWFMPAPAATVIKIGKKCIPGAVILAGIVIWNLS